MPELEFVIYLTNPDVVATDDDCGLEVNDLPKKIPVAPIIRSRHKAERLVAMLRGWYGNAEFTINAWPPDEYRTEQAMIGSMYTPAEDGEYGRRIQALIERSNWLCKVIEGDRDLPVLKDTEGEADEAETLKEAEEQQTPARRSPKVADKNAAAETMSAEARALAVLADHPDWTDVRIAQAAGVHRSMLYKWPKYKQVRAIAKEAGKQDRTKRSTRR